MNRVTVDENTVGQLATANGQMEVCDRNGRVLGYFVPAHEDYDGPECPLSAEELERIEREGGGRPLADILADLKSRP